MSQSVKDVLNIPRKLPIPEFSHLHVYGLIRESIVLNVSLLCLTLLLSVNIALLQLMTHDFSKTALAPTLL